MLLDAIATVILAGLMLVPLVNVIAGGVVGAGLLGPLGGIVGILLAIAITALETWIADRLGWRDLRCGAHDTVMEVAEQTRHAPAEAICSVRSSHSTIAAAVNDGAPTTASQSQRRKYRRLRDGRARSLHTDTTQERRRGSRR